ncbi:alpha/beta hydrolase [Uniformispora flossi]|uniref:alpha/beta hydrolase n=1 Tax=Uniformispora flossi TaxID=3390723 RepID=UPI003C2FE1DE
MVDVYQLRDADLGALGAAALRWRQLAEALDKAESNAANNVGWNLRGSHWTGPAADAAYRNLDRLDGDLRHAAQECRLVFTAVDAAHGVFAAQQAKLRKLLDDAAGRFFVTAGGEVTYQEVTFGAGATTQDIEYATRTNDAMRGGAADLHGGIAAIMWLGYDAPQQALTESSRTIYADHGAPKLAQFSAGLTAAHEGPPANTTLIAHSYASLVAGRALERNGMTLDNLVVVGGVGTGPEHATDLHMPADHVWAGTAAADLVPDEAIPVNPSKWFDDSSVRFGADPTSEKFGANTLPTDRGDMPSSPITIPAHSQYWDARSSSLKAMGLITAGKMPPQ